MKCTITDRGRMINLNQASYKALKLSGKARRMQHRDSSLGGVQVPVPVPSYRIPTYYLGSGPDYGSDLILSFKEAKAPMLNNYAEIILKQVDIFQFFIPRYLPYVDVKKFPKRCKKHSKMYKTSRNTQQISSHV